MAFNIESVSWIFCIYINYLNSYHCNASMKLRKWKQGWGKGKEASCFP